ncbi:DNA mismatch repair endonuclease MutL [Vibrio sp.]|nr:DNA mismatch repair endonuclease MutL [Vibrio sp.]
MPIRILPARLANQIAAGEVVERPASVVKELVENSLDAGANRIDIDIEKGGSKLIRIRDNGKGIAKDELELALSRHATSKITSLDDLEAIMSLGFRGEALASISSVARLTLTSRTATQGEAWAAHSEGRDMEVRIQPAAHPVGSTVEVIDLFFNTPARRKFLRMDKTEFAHIDELLKRIALSRLDVSFTLKHNGKVVRQYRAAKTEIQTEKRLAAICSNSFVQNMLKVSVEHQGLTLSGWIATPEGARSQGDVQFCYVNGRMMKDKLINHAIRQSYDVHLQSDQYAAYVLFIELDPHQVDVNVHPAKHEVRFHQARLVHDFIYQSLVDALVQGAQLPKAPVSHAAFAQSVPTENRMSEKGIANDNDAAEHHGAIGGDTVEENDSMPAPSIPQRDGIAPRSIVPKSSASHSNFDRARQHQGNEGYSPRTQSKVARSSHDAPTQQEIKAYQALLTTPEQEESLITQSSVEAEVRVTEYPDTMPAVTPDLAKRVQEGKTKYEPQSTLMVNGSEHGAITELGKALSVVNHEYLLVTTQEGIGLISLYSAKRWRLKGQLTIQEAPLKAQPLLIPMQIQVQPLELDIAEKYKDILIQFGIDLRKHNSRSLMVLSVAQPLREVNLNEYIAGLLVYLSQLNAENVSIKVITDWLSSNLPLEREQYTLSSAIQLLSEVEQLWHGELPLDDRKFIRLVDFAPVIGSFNA